MKILLRMLSELDNDPWTIHGITHLRPTDLSVVGKNTYYVLDEGGNWVGGREDAWQFERVKVHVSEANGSNPPDTTVWITFETKEDARKYARALRARWKKVAGNGFKDPSEPSARYFVIPNPPAYQPPIILHSHSVYSNQTSDSGDEEFVVQYAVDHLRLAHKDLFAVLLYDALRRRDNQAWAALFTAEAPALSGMERALAAEGLSIDDLPTLFDRENQIGTGDGLKMLLAPDGPNQVRLVFPTLKFDRSKGWSTVSAPHLDSSAISWM